MPNIWLEKTSSYGYRSKKEFAPGMVLISPMESTSGADIYKFMRQVKKGDVILHLLNNEAIIGLSLVESSYQVMKREFTENYIVRLMSFRKLAVSFGREAIFSEQLQQEFLNLQKAGVKDLFFDSKLKLRQGAYLTPVHQSLFLLLDTGYKLISNGSSLNVELSGLIANGGSI